MTNDDVLQKIQHLIGSPYVFSVKAYITELTGRTRVVGPNEVSTKELDLNRIHIIANDESTIKSFNFG
ncbi:hypothetical protein NVV94_26005 [Pseudomonas sp. LS1212]|uniref:hypothetical protein n=1 Tax=Pseudomonas sp. LS1212 TaxID=2972478 RepID=UPI00215CE24D|nr:hypothetical protein [Pseudomonas sp. LS1212]UVJ43928.1 hypothetical protein NVV94_26005 [Pseudomonas sp. LS1212]